MARWLRMLSGQEPPDKPSEPGGDRLLVSVARELRKAVEAKLEQGAASIEDLKPEALADLYNALTLAKEAGRKARKPREMVAASKALAGAVKVMREWLADERGTSGAGHVTAIRIIMNQPAAVSGDKAAENGHARPRSLEAGGLRIRLNGDDAGT